MQPESITIQCHSAFHCVLAAAFLGVRAAESGDSGVRGISFSFSCLVPRHPYPRAVPESWLLTDRCFGGVLETDSSLQILHLLWILAWVIPKPAVILVQNPPR